MFQEEEEHVQRSCDRINPGWYKALKEGSMAGGEGVRGKTGQGNTRFALDKGHSGFRAENRLLGAQRECWEMS